VRLAGYNKLLAILQFTNGLHLRLVCNPDLLTLCVGHLCGPLEQPAVQVEDVTGVGLATGGTPEQKRHLPVGDGLL
jgi:hypothetical protein